MNDKYLSPKETYEPIKLSPTLEKKALTILNVKSPLDSPDFNPTDYINRLFPNEQSLASIDSVLDKIKSKTEDLARETERLTTAQTTTGKQGTEEELGKAKYAIKDLFQKIQDIKVKAAQSESMVHDITQDVKSLDYAKRNLTSSVTVLKRLQMLVTAVDQLETMSRNKQYKESAQFLQAVIQLMQHFKSYKSVPQIAALSDRINYLQKELGNAVYREFEMGFSSDGILVTQPWLLNDACQVASVLGDPIREKIISHYVDLQLMSYRQVFLPSEEVSQIDNISRRYALLKRVLKTCDEEHRDIFPSDWCTSGIVSEKFCNYTRSDLEQILANHQPDVKELLKALQLTIEFEAQLDRRFERYYKLIDDKRYPMFQFEKSISRSFHPYLWIYIEAKDRTLTDMISSYIQSDKTADDDANMTVLPSSTDLFYFYRETLTQCARFSAGGAFWDLCQLFAKHLLSYCENVLMKGIARDERQPITKEHLRLVVLALNTADYCCITTSQLEEKLNNQIDSAYKDKLDLQNVKDAFMTTVSYCIDAVVRGLMSSFETQFQQMIRLPWATMDTVGDQSDYVTQIQESATGHLTVVGKTIANKRYFRTFYDRLADTFLTKYIINIFKCKVISEIGAEQLLLDTHSIKTLLMDIPSFSSDESTTIPTSYGKLVNRGISKAELILKTVMTPTEPMAGYVENYLFLVGDKNVGTFVRLLDLKGLRRPDQTALVDVFQRKAAQQTHLTNNPNLLPSMDSTSSITSSSSSLSLSSSSSSVMGGGIGLGAAAGLPSNITTSLSNMASSAASNFNTAHSPLTQFGRNSISPSSSPSLTPLSPTPDGQSKTGRLNENFRKLVMTGMAFRKGLQERKDQNKD
ncbi:Vps53-like protein [Halteromyces radiatus]|uniref:Vps53-like protein n=1 Tax=Halteromyces radiatus TaxID=101107 RepID=UPI00222036F3|nr:Vps53-like protein [Halteromyces radiatus]KAI8076866.1 Vps53-like protein [Halteromyces radiatus]